MIRTKDLEEFVNALVVYGTKCYSPPIEEYRAEIIKRLRAYDRICRDLKQVIATLSNGVDTK